MLHLGEVLSSEHASVALKVSALIWRSSLALCMLSLGDIFSSERSSVVLRVLVGEILSSQQSSVGGSSREVLFSSAARGSSRIAVVTPTRGFCVGRPALVVSEHKLLSVNDVTPLQAVTSGRSSGSELATGAARADRVVAVSSSPAVVLSLVRAEAVSSSPVLLLPIPVWSSLAVPRVCPGDGVAPAV